MTTNRNAISNSEIIRPTQLLDKGIPFIFLEGKYTVDEGWVAVITEGGAYKETLRAGTHFLGRYKIFRDLKATPVDTRIKTLIVSTKGEFSIAQPVPVEINLDLSVEYRVADAQRVVTEITTPLTSLFDRVIQAVRGSVVNANVDEIRTQGEGIARNTLKNLQAMQLPTTIGIEVLNVLTTSIKPTDVGSDALAGIMFDQFTKVQNWKVDDAILRGSQITPQWLMVHRPELYAALMAGNQEIVKELIDKGLFDPAGFLNQPATGTTMNPDQLLGGYGQFGIPGLPNTSMQSSQGYQNGSIPNSPQLSGGVRDIHGRIREEIKILEKQAGVQVSSQAGVDEHGVPDGSYNIKVSAPRNSGGEINLYVVCEAGYPQQPPVIEVEVNGETTPFQSAILRRWTGQYIIELVREVKQFFG